MVADISSGSNATEHAFRHEPRTRLSIERKLPLIIGGLLLVVIAALSVAAYLEARRSSMQVAGERLHGATTQLRLSLAQSAAQLRTAAAAIAAQPPLVVFARRRDTVARAGALAALRSADVQGAGVAQVLGTELRDASGNVVLSTVPASYGTATIALNDVIPRTEPGDSALVGAFRFERDTAIYPIAAAIPGGGDLYIVRWRRLGGGQANRELIPRLIGSDASLFIGNADGTAWSDFAGSVPGPVQDPASTDGLHAYERAGGKRYLASIVPVPGTPWLVAVDFPRANVMAPVNRFVRELALIALLALVLGLLAAWILSRRITQPLRQLTHAAQAIAHGDYDQQVRIGHTDEFSVLGAAFTTMAAEVKHSRDELEQKVEVRTRDLNQALVQLHDAQDALVRRERLAMLGQLSSGVGHELRNPLGVMTNAVYYLRTVLGQAPANVHEYLDILAQQIALSEKIVGDLLDFAREKPPQRQPAFLAQAVDAQLERLAMRDGVRIGVDAPADLPPVLVDPVHLGQIVLNLLTNAVQAMGGSGRLTVRTRSNGTMNHLEVSDTGPGVAPENREKIFEPLFTTKARGIGLGLAVSRTLARANGGDLTLVTEPLAGGATFRLTLPIATEGAA
ncbi:MAG: ATP-binding protein [Gemmatimonadaceae bacterium]